MCYWNSWSFKHGLGNNQQHTLRSWVSVLGPSKRVAVEVKQCVLLFNSEPRVVALGFRHDLYAR